jgi:hypothetical protein
MMMSVFPDLRPVIVTMLPVEGTMLRTPGFEAVQVGASGTCLELLS